MTQPSVLDTANCPAVGIQGNDSCPTPNLQWRQVHIKPCSLGRVLPSAQYHIIKNRMHLLLPDLASKSTCIGQECHVGPNLESRDAPVTSTPWKRSLTLNHWNFWCYSWYSSSMFTCTPWPHPTEWPVALQQRVH